MIADELLRWVVTILFGLAAAQCLYLMVVKSMPWQAYVGHALHLIMSVAMLLMAWPFSADWPTVGPLWFFVAAAVWFLASLAVPNSSRPAVDCGCVPSTSTTTGRMAAVYHAAMMGAMAWMYAVMNGSLLPGTPAAQPMALALGPGGVGSGHPVVLAHSHGGGDMGGMDMTHMAPQPGYVAPVNWVLALGFAVAAALWLYLYFDRRRRAGAPDDVLSFAGDLCQVFMATGMSIMFFVMVV
ncbi:DUF5134 domain-containing protein [Gordonia sp. NPDC003504]